MGTSRDAAEFSQKIVKMATITQRRQKDIVTEGALATKQIIIAAAAAKGITPQSKIAKKRWSVGFDVKGFDNPSALVKIRGPFHLVDRDTKAHQIRRKTRRGRTGKALRLADGQFRTVVDHPGTKGKGIFAASKATAGVTVPRVMSRSVVSGWGQALR